MTRRAFKPYRHSREGGNPEAIRKHERMHEVIPLDYMILLLGMGLVTYIPRWLPLFFLTRYRLSGFFVEWLELIPVSILSALLLPALITRGNPRFLDIFQPEMWVAIPTFVFALWTKSLGGTVITGMLLFWLAEKLF
jgi:branched-subunit amino acid transport protein